MENSVIASVAENEGAAVVSYTPQTCLRILREQGFVFDIEISEMKDEESLEYRPRRWRTEIWESRQCQIKGTAEGARKLLSRCAAILDLLNNLRESNFVGFIPNCKIPTGVKISPSILILLENVCQLENVGVPEYTTVLIGENGSDHFRTTCQIGDCTFVATSYDERFSKLHAALKAYKQFGHRDFVLDEPVMGSDCLPIEEYHLIEMDQTHIVTAIQRGNRNPQAKRVLMDFDVPQLPPRLSQIRLSKLRSKAEDVSLTTVSNESGGSTTNVGNVEPLTSPQLLEAYQNLIKSTPLMSNDHYENESFLQLPVFQTKDISTPRVSEEHCTSNGMHPKTRPSAVYNGNGFVLEDPLTPDTLNPQNFLNSLNVGIEKPAVHISQLLGDFSKWEKFKKDILRYLPFFKDFSDDDDDENAENGSEKSSVNLIVSGVGFGKTLKLADFLCSKNLDGVARNTEFIEDTLRVGSQECGQEYYAVVKTDV